MRARIANPASALRGGEACDVTRLLSHRRFYLYMNIYIYIYIQYVYARGIEREREIESASARAGYTYNG